MKCIDCNKNGCAKRVIDQETRICPECTAKRSQLEENVAEFNENDLLSDIKFTDFKSWLMRELHVVKDEIEKSIKPLNDDIKKLKKELTTTCEKLNTSEGIVIELKGTLKSLYD